jgi:hypothetical protein
MRPKFFLPAIILVLAGGTWAHAGPLLSPDDAAFFHDQAKRIVAAARVAPGDKSGDMINTTPYAITLPDSGHVYMALWPRDSNMSLGADFVSIEDVQGWIKLMAATVLAADWQVRPGIKVPAYFLPDHVNFNGKATYYPASMDTGTAQGGGTAGNIPPLDDNYFFLFTVSEYWSLTKKTDLFKSEMTTPGGPVVLSDLCLKVFDAVPIDEATGLPITGAIDSPDNARDFGFCDGVWKSGKLMFTAVLKYDAAQRLIPQYRAIGNQAAVDHLEKTAALIKKNLGPTFYHESTTPGEGWLHSASDFSNQPDIWGSAYAVAVGAVDAETAPKIARALLRGFKDRTTVISGCASQVLHNDPTHPGGWMKSTCAFGDYQNGGYWGTGTGWYIIALNTIDPAAAHDMATDFVRFLRANINSDGLTQSWEVFNPDKNEYIHPHYVASTAFPYGLLKRAGLIP